MYGKLNDSALQELQQQANSSPQRLKFVIDQAALLPRAEASLQHVDYEVKGCEAKVWLKVEATASGYCLRMDSPSRVIKGLLALIYQALHGASPTQVQQFDLDAYLAALRLDDMVSVSRRNGLRNVVQHIQQATT